MTINTSSVYSGSAAKRLLLCGTALALCVTQVAAAADKAAEPAESAAAEENIFDEIIVTATKRSERLQDVPISVTAFGEQKLEELRPDNLADLSDHVSNMYLPPAKESSSQYITLRGLGSGVVRSGGRAVGVYIDGVYMSADNLANLPIADIASLEVLKGPQGTLFGRDTIGGAINVTTRKPGNVLDGYIQAEIGNFGRTVFQGGLDVPIVEDKLSLRVSAKKLDSSGYIENLYDGKKADGQDQFFGRAQLFYTPSDKFDARVTYTYSERDDNPTTGENAAGLYADQVPYQVNVDVRETFVQHTNALSLAMNYYLNSGYTLTSITGWSRNKDRSLVDRDMTPDPVSTQAITYQIEDLSQELRLTSPDSEKFEYLAGLYYLHSTVENRDVYPLFGAAWLANIGFPPILPDVLDGQERNYTTDSLALFVHGTYHLTDKLSAFGGLRYTSDKKDVSVQAFGEIFTALGFLTGNISGETDDNPISWTGGLRYEFSDAVKTYASVSRGYRSSAIKDDFLTAKDLAAPDGFATKPEYVTNYEVGAKIRGWDGRLNTNAAVFYMDYTDIQVAVSVPPLLFVRQLQNAAKAHIWGFEWDGSLALTDNLQVAASLGYLKTRYDEFEPSPGVDLSGTGFGNAPKWSYSTAVDYTYPIEGRGEVNLHADFSGITVPSDFAPSRAALALGGYNTLNALVAYEPENHKWGVTLWAKNILNHSDTTSSTTWGAGLGANQHSVYVYQPPRSYGVTLKYFFN